MRGVGINPGTTIDRAPGRCLDLTRLFTRVGRGPFTGIDRVELAYLRQLLTQPDELFVLVRGTVRYFLLDRAGAQTVLEIMNTATPPQGRLSRAKLELRLGRLAISASFLRGLKGALAKHLPAGISYLNVGHSNLSEDVFSAIKAVPNSRITVLVHDVIPLDHPEFTRAEMVSVFEQRMRAVGRHANLVIYVSEHSKKQAEKHFAKWGRVPEGVCVHLGVELAQPQVEDVPTGVDLDAPYFVALGTIEPRKNHAFLLDIWEEMAKTGTPPRLYIVGSRGWASADFFKRLDDFPMLGNEVQVFSGLGDGAVAALLEHSAGLLFPSLAEGFGLPPAEAALRGTPVICAELAVYREFLGDIPVYADVEDMYQWIEEIRALAIMKSETSLATRKTRLSAEQLGWDRHFNNVLRVV